MKQVNNYIHKRKKGAFSNIKGDKELFNKIVNDMKMNAGDLSPRVEWHLVSKSEEEMSHPSARAFDDIYTRYDDKAYQKRFSSSEKILDMWIGCVGMESADIKTLKQYEEFFSTIDFLGLFETLKEEHEKFDYIITDWGSIIDINLISGLIDPDIEKLNVLEVGGGYGRLAETFLNVYKGQVKYVMLDSVPASLMYAYLYLKKNYPDLNIGIYYNDDEFDMNEFDVYIMPPWHFEKLNNLSYDVCINIESMQEMLQFHVDYYMDLFNRHTKDEGIIYISNSHDYLFKGDWNYPENWERLMSFNTPRSWSINHPTEIFKNKKGSYKIQNAFIEAGFKHHLKQTLFWKDKCEKLRKKLDKFKHFSSRKLFRLKIQNYSFALFFEKGKKLK